MYICLLRIFFASEPSEKREKIESLKNKENQFSCFRATTNTFIKFIESFKLTTTDLFLISYFFQSINCFYIIIHQ